MVPPKFKATTAGTGCHASSFKPLTLFRRPFLLLFVQNDSHPKKRGTYWPFTVYQFAGSVFSSGVPFFNTSILLVFLRNFNSFHSNFSKFLFCSGFFGQSSADFELGCVIGIGDQFIDDACAVGQHFIQSRC